MSRTVPAAFLAFFLAAAAACGKSGDFRHAAHVTVTKGDCAPCHGSDPSAPRRPVNADCAACHKQAREPSAAGAGRYGVVKGPSVSARRPGFGRTAFPHAPHAASGIPCAECHGATKWRGNEFVLPTEEECGVCHSRPPQRDARRPERLPGDFDAGAQFFEKILI